MKDGHVRDFRLNTQCSAGNGYFLQGTALAFGLPVEEYAERAFTAEVAPEFSYGCAVFLQADIVDFQRRGFSREEILAGLCRVLPKNIWLYVAKIPNLARLGQRFVLQGGTQYNLAAVKAQVDHIVDAFRGSGVEPDVRVHPHAGEGGAIGAALEAQAMLERGHQSHFIGLEALAALSYAVTRDESTRCGYCSNSCMRTFVDLEADGVAPDRRVVVAACETGMAASGEEMRAISASIKAVRKGTPNLVDEHARAAFKASGVGPVATDAGRLTGRRLAAPLTRLLPRATTDRAALRVGMPRVMAFYSLAPFFRAYFESLGLQPANLVFTPFTSDKLYRAGATRGAIDPCFPSKLALSHMHHLLHTTQQRRPLDAIFFPLIDDMPTYLEGTQRSCACPTTATTPLTVRAAFTKERDAFAEAGVQLLTPYLQLSHAEQAERELWQRCGPLLGLTRRENRRAVEVAYQHMQSYYAALRRRCGQVLTRLEREAAVGIVVLSRPYHCDPGVHHGIIDELQKRGYPILATDSLPYDDDALLQRLFEVPAAAARRVDDVWKNSYSENTNRKLWAAKFVARHPNLVALELSSFKCGHDAAVNTVVERVLAAGRTPHFAFKEIDENKPAGAIKIRVETISYFLERYRGRLQGGHGEVDLGVQRGRPERRAHSASGLEGMAT